MGNEFLHTQLSFQEQTVVSRSQQLIALMNKLGVESVDLVAGAVRLTNLGFLVPVVNTDTTEEEYQLANSLVEVTSSINSRQSCTRATTLATAGSNAMATLLDELRKYILKYEQESCSQTILQNNINEQIVEGM